MPNIYSIFCFLFIVSSTFGFGLLDIGVLVEKSKNWTTVPAKQTCNKLTQFNTP